MSYADGWAALQLEMPSRIPRTEYSAESHWDLIHAVTGRDVTPQSSPEVQTAARKAFMQAWNYDLCWSVLITHQVFGEMCTRMGHAEYAAGGVDFDTNVRSPFSDPEEVLAFDLWDVFGPQDQSALTAQFEAHYQANCDFYPDGVNMTGIYVTGISGLIDLFGWDLLLLALGMDPQRMGAMLGRYASWMQQFFDALAAADVPVVMVHDDIVWTSGPFYDPEWYRTYLFPHYKSYFAPLRESGKKILYTSDGDYTAFIDDIVATGVHGLILEPMTDMAYIAERYGKTHVFIGNADTRILLHGDRPAIRREVERCMAIGKDCPGFFMAVGNHIPSNTPVENALYYNEVYNELSRR